MVVEIPAMKTSSHSATVSSLAGSQGFSSNFGKRPLAKTTKLGEINNIEHNKGSKIYPRNQIILDCIMPSIFLMHKCLSFILIWVSVSH